MELTINQQLAIALAKEEEAYAARGERHPATAVYSSTSGFRVIDDSDVDDLDEDYASRY